MITIERAANGYIVRPAGEDARLVASDDPAEATRGLLWELLDLVDPSGTQHDECLVVVRFEHGHRWLNAHPTGCRHAVGLQGWEDDDGRTRWTCPCGLEFAPVDPER